MKKIIKYITVLSVIFTSINIFDNSCFASSVEENIKKIVVENQTPKDVKVRIIFSVPEEGDMESSEVLIPQNFRKVTNISDFCEEGKGHVVGSSFKTLKIYDIDGTLLQSAEIPTSYKGGKLRIILRKRPANTGVNL